MTAIDMRPATGVAAGLGVRFTESRRRTEALCAPLEVEDDVVSSMSDVSPTTWHLAHTSWFYETFLLAEHDPSYRSPHPRYAYLFSSYCVQAGERQQSSVSDSRSAVPYLPRRCALLTKVRSLLASAATAAFALERRVASPPSAHLPQMEGP